VSPASTATNTHSSDFQLLPPASLHSSIFSQPFCSPSFAMGRSVPTFCAGLPASSSSSQPKMAQGPSSSSAVPLPLLSLHPACSKPPARSLLCHSPIFKKHRKALRKSFRKPHSSVPRSLLRLWISAWGRGCALPTSKQHLQQCAALCRLAKKPGPCCGRPSRLGGNTTSRATL